VTFAATTRLLNAFCQGFAQVESKGSSLCSIKYQQPNAGPVFQGLTRAMVEANLGMALATLGDREGGTARLKEAVVAYQAALEELDASTGSSRLSWNRDESRQRTAISGSTGRHAPSWRRQSRHFRFRQRSRQRAIPGTVLPGHDCAWTGSKADGMRRMRRGSDFGAA
jgi:hypothetical protein